MIKFIKGRVMIMLKMNYEFRKGILFIRLFGHWNKNNSKKIQTNINTLTKNVGIRNIVLNIDDINSIDLTGIRFIMKYYYQIIASQGQFLICDKYQRFSKQLMNNTIPNINYELEAFNLI